MSRTIAFVLPLALGGRLIWRQRAIHLSQVVSGSCRQRSRDYPGSYGELLAWFPDDHACIDYLEWLRWPTGCAARAVSAEPAGD
jgi:hypothetical protein